MNLGLALLRYAATVRRLGSFSAAARDCGVSQPTVSNAIAELEGILGARLFERTTRSLSLTPAGEKLFPLVEASLSAVGDLEREAKALRMPERKLVRVGFSPLVGAQKLATLFGPFAQQRSDVELVYKECARGDMEERLDRGTIDVVCGTHIGKARNRSRRPLYREALQWIPPGGLRPGRTSASLREIAKSRLVLTVDTCGLAAATREMFQDEGLRIDEYDGHAMSFGALEEWAELGIGGAILPASHIRRARGATVLRDGVPAELSYEVVWRKDLIVAKHAKEFVNYVRTVVSRLVVGLAQ